MNWKANLAQDGLELTVYFEVVDVNSEICKACGVSIDQSGEVVIESMVAASEICPGSPIWLKVEKRLNRLFSNHLCDRHLWELAERYDIFLGLA